MLNAIGLANPGRERFLADHLPGSASWASRSGSASAAFVPGLRRDVRALSASRRSSSTCRARTSTRRRNPPPRSSRLPRGDGAAVLREALGQRTPTSPRSRVPSRQPAPMACRSSTRSAGPRSTSDARPVLARGSGGLSGPSAQAGRPPRGDRLPRGHRSSHRRDGRDRDRPDALEFSACGARTSRSELSSSPIPAPRHAFAPSWPPRRGCRRCHSLTTRGASQKARKPREKSRLDAHGRIGKIGRP